ncbi:16103_t:CDS:2, partial [Dentiscutata erythropus]
MGCITSKLSQKAESESIKSQSSQNEFLYADGRRFHNVNEAIYVLPNDEEESDRLHLQHFLIRYIWQSNFSAPIEHILSKSRSKILDVGCGAASWSFDMATTYPSTDIVGIDISPHQPTHIKPSNFKFIKANVLERLPFDDNTFDFIFQRFMVSAIPEQKWPDVINELVRVLKPGGYLELCEFSRMLDVGPAEKRLWYTMAKALEKKGVDWDTYEKLEGYAQNQGQLENIKKEVKQCYHGKRSNNIELSKVAINNMNYLYLSLKHTLTNVAKLFDEDEYDELVETVKKEEYEYDMYFHMLKKPNLVQDKKGNTLAAEWGTTDVAGKNFWKGDTEDSVCREGDVAKKPLKK